VGKLPQGLNVPVWQAVGHRRGGFPFSSHQEVAEGFRGMISSFFTAHRHHIISQEDIPFRLPPLDLLGFHAQKSNTQGEPLPRITLRSSIP
jgi:hypothetical protein